MPALKLLFLWGFNVSVHLVHGFISCTPNTIAAISKMRLYNAT
jgi:hypothetical protein